MSAGEAGVAYANPLAAPDDRIHETERPVDESATPYHERHSMLLTVADLGLHLLADQHLDTAVFDPAVRDPRAIASGR
jgi:hypothetical protein